MIRLHAKLNNRIKYEFFQKLEGEETYEKKYQQQVNTIQIYHKHMDTRWKDKQREKEENGQNKRKRRTHTYGGRKFFTIHGIIMLVK